MRRLLCTLGLLLLLLLGLGPGPVAAQVPEAAPGPAQSPRLAWAEIVARDARVGFSPRTLIVAGEALRSDSTPKERRAAAWLALGSASAAVRRAELIETAKNGSEPERGAAILALGELGDGAEALLLEIARGPDPELGSLALLALLRTHDPALRRAVEAIAGDAQDPRSSMAAKLLVFVGDPARAEPTPAAERLLELRWRAAREFGLVDGQTWQVLVYRALGESAEFRTDVILRAGAKLDKPLVRDLLLGALLHGSGPGRLRAAARGIPRELAQLVQNGLWKPADAGEWAVLFDELQENRHEAYTPEIFEAALAVPEEKARALDLLSRAGVQDLSAEIEAALSGAGPDDRVQLCRAMGESEDPTYLQRLGLLAGSGEPKVRAAALVAELLLGSRPGDAAVRAALGKRGDPLRAALLVELAANARAMPAQLLLEDEFARAGEDERRPLALALAREGVREARAWCRKALGSEPPPPPEAARELVLALRARISSEDTEALRAAFPRDHTPENLALNIELALALCELGDAWVHPLMHAALWRGNFEVSLLAGALFAQATGIHALRDEAANPPASARSTDLRRVGFALGSLGGLPEVEALAQALRYNSGSPALQGALLGFLSTRTH